MELMASLDSDDFCFEYFWCWPVGRRDSHFISFENSVPVPVINYFSCGSAMSEWCMRTQGLRYSVRVLVWLKYSKISTLSKKITSSPIFNEGISNYASGSVEDTKCQNEHHDQNNL